MPSPFDAIHLQIFRETSRVWGEQFTHKPVKSRPNKQTIPDDERQARCFVGEFRRPAHTESMAGYGQRAGHAAISTKVPTLRVALVDVDDVRQGDTIERLEPHAVYQVSDVQPDGRGVARLELLETTTARQAP